MVNRRVFRKHDDSLFRLLLRLRIKDLECWIGISDDIDKGIGIGQRYLFNLILVLHYPSLVLRHYKRIDQFVQLSIYRG